MQRADREHRHAFADESYDQTAEGFYVLAAAVFDPDALAEAREVMAELRARPHARKVHWYEMDPTQRRRATEQLRSLEGLHVVVVGAPVPTRRAERARAMCLTTLVHELYGYDVTHLHMETRETSLDARDIDTVKGARYQLPPPGTFVVRHEPPSEAVFRAADVTAGAVRAARLGDETYRKLLRDRLYELDIDTGA